MAVSILTTNKKTTHFRSSPCAPCSSSCQAPEVCRWWSLHTGGGGEPSYRWETDHPVTWCKAKQLRQTWKKCSKESRVLLLPGHQYISKDLKWELNISSLTNKAWQRLHFLWQMRWRASTPTLQGPSSPHPSPLLLRRTAKVVCLFFLPWQKAADHNLMPQELSVHSWSKVHSVSSQHYNIETINSRQWWNATIFKYGVIPFSASIHFLSPTVWSHILHF